MLSSLWLAAALAEEIPVIALVERDRAVAAARARGKARKAGQQLWPLVAAEDLCLRPGSAGALVIEALTDIEDAAADYLIGLMPALRADGSVVSLDATKDPATEARIAGIFLAAALTGITQERPKEGALITVGQLPPAVVLAALATRGAARDL